ncbi:hypothetical protein OFAG_01137 [Oxalobacter formigenes HOxBLS]|uniref:Uncharacterized protein n=1 Tax=Oxalobacter paraformigenes TaxID=556268 RepID=C3X448_9BURK|nr:hypothetical protein OFAG_01137 [Oxalobacter paraformigenes]
MIFGQLWLSGFGKLSVRYVREQTGFRTYLESLPESPAKRQSPGTGGKIVEGICMLKEAGAVLKRQASPDSAVSGKVTHPVFAARQGFSFPVCEDEFLKKASFLAGSSAVSVGV